MERKEVYELGVNLMEKHPELSKWKFGFNNRKRSFGITNHTYKKIEVSLNFIPYVTQDSIKNTILHEIAHALTPGHNHDYVWKKKCIELGANPERLGGDEEFEEGSKGAIKQKQATAKYLLICPCCGYTVYLNRYPKKSFSCGQHFTRGYDPKYKMELKLNPQRSI